VVELACDMQSETSKFSTLFKKYRLKAELSTLSELGSALAEKGFIYEDSIFSHWQRGTRIPQNRIILLKLLEIFIDRKSILTLDQAIKTLTTAMEPFIMVLLGVGVALLIISVLTPIYNLIQAF